MEDENIKQAKGELEVPGGIEEAVWGIKMLRIRSRY